MRGFLVRFVFDKETQSWRATTFVNGGKFEAMASTMAEAAKCLLHWVNMEAMRLQLPPPYGGPWGGRKR